MLRSLKSLEGYTVSATDGDVGTVVDLLLDDERWAVRYLVIEMGGVLGGRRVIVSPVSFRDVDWTTNRFHLALTVDKIKNSPSVDVDQPVSRQHELDHIRYYGYPSYWGYAGMWGVGAYPALLRDEPKNHARPESPDVSSGDRHLRSAREVRGYHVQGSDASIGHVDDFVADDETWAVRYLVIATRDWWFGKKVLVSPGWANRVSYDERNVYLDLSRETIKSSPAWEPTAPVNREYEARLYDYYGRPAYWSGDQRAQPLTHAAHPRP